MISAQQQRDWLQKLAGQMMPKKAANADAFSQAKNDALGALSTLPALSSKQEAWRYSRIDKLFEQGFTPVTDDAGQMGIETFMIPDFDSYRLVLVNGRYQPQLSNTQALPAGISISSLQQLASEDRSFHLEQHAEHLLTALNTAALQDGLVIRLDDGVQLDKPVEVMYLNTASSAFITGRTLVAMGRHSAATLVERFISSGEPSYFHNHLCDIRLAEQASLNHYRIQDESRNAWHLGSLYLVQNSHSHYTANCLSFGGAWARTEINVLLQQEYAECELNGLYSAGEKQLNDFHLDVQHRVPHCISRERFKGILYGKGRAVFDGRIVVDKQAQKSDAQLSNDNLLLTRDAEIDTKPQLEIYADDVKCSHGTTVGQLDEQQIFYMRSRGIAESTARKMLCLGFAGEVVDSIEPAALRKHASDKLMAALSEAVNAMEQQHGDKENVLSQ